MILSKAISISNLSSFICSNTFRYNIELNFLPSPGKITDFSIPNSNNIRADFGYFEGDYVSSYYDSMLGKLIVHGKNREKAVKLLSGALKETLIVGVDSNIDFLRRIIDHQSFKKTHGNLQGSGKIKGETGYSGRR